MSQWMDAGYEDSAKAMQEIGPTAGHYILAKLARVDSKYGSGRQYRNFWAKLPCNVRVLVPKPESGNLDELRAASMLLEFGPPVTPLLVEGLGDHNPAVRLACARALGCLHSQGSDIRKAFPALNQAMHDPNPEVASLAASALRDQRFLVAPGHSLTRLDE